METWETKSKRYRFALQNLFADGPVADGVTRLFATIRNEGLDEAAALADQENSESLGLKIRNLRAEEKSDNQTARIPGKGSSCDTGDPR